MAFPQVLDSYTVQKSAATSHDIPMPSTVTSGDLLMVMAKADATVSAPSGWSGLEGVTGEPYVRVSDGTEGGTNETFTTDSSVTLAAIVVQIGQWEGTISNGLDVTQTYTESSTHDPPSLTVDWGVADNLWLAQLAVIDDDETVDSFPSGYTNTLGQISGGGLNTSATVGHCQQEINTDTEDPGAFGLSGSENGYAYTIAVQPGSSGGTGGGGGSANSLTVLGA